MKKFIVLYEAFAGEPEVFGPFETLKNAITWMNSDYEYNAKLAGIDVTDPMKNEKTFLELFEYGSWKVLEINKP